MGKELERLIEQYGGKVPTGSDEDIALAEIARLIELGDLPDLMKNPMAEMPEVVELLREIKGNKHGEN